MTVAASQAIAASYGRLVQQCFSINGISPDTIVYLHTFDFKISCFTLSVSLPDILLVPTQQPHVKPLRFGVTLNPNPKPLTLNPITPASDTFGEWFLYVYVRAKPVSGQSGLAGRMSFACYKVCEWAEMVYGRGCCAGWSF